jgi:hypothetical protein
MVTNVATLKSSMQGFFFPQLFLYQEFDFFSLGKIEKKVKFTLGKK